MAITLRIVLVEIYQWTTTIQMNIFKKIFQGGTLITIQALQTQLLVTKF